MPLGRLGLDAAVGARGARAEGGRDGETANRNGGVGCAGGEARRQGRAAVVEAVGCLMLKATREDL